MSAMKTIEVSLTEAEYEDTVRLAAAQGMTGEQWIQQAVRSLALEEARRAARARELLEALQRTAEQTDPAAPVMTMEEIIEEIALARREKADLAKSA